MSLWLAYISALTAWLAAELTDHLSGHLTVSSCLFDRISIEFPKCLCVWKPDRLTASLNFCLNAELCDYLSVDLNLWLPDCTHLSLFLPAFVNCCLAEWARQWITHNHINWQENGDKIIDRVFILFYYVSINTTCCNPSNCKKKKKEETKQIKIIISQCLRNYLICHVIHCKLFLLNVSSSKPKSLTTSGLLQLILDIQGEKLGATAIIRARELATASAEMDLSPGEKLHVVHYYYFFIRSKNAL